MEAHGIPGLERDEVLRRALLPERVLSGFGAARHDSGNWAFEEYRRKEIERLEEERRRLEEESRAFTEFVDELKRARDREQFDAFMARRRAGSNY